ncbi:MAG: S4 domain-containing protein, partial [Steroidobacteraceae bacterium]
RRRGSGRRTAPAPAAQGPAPERLQKVLARAGVASRRVAEAWIRAGRLTINGKPAVLGARVGPHDKLQLDGRTIHAPAPRRDPRTFLCHRSPGTSLAACLERLPRGAGRRLIAVSPMPEVDGGLELVSADGELVVRLQRSVHSLPCTFSVRVRGEASEAQLAGVLGGELDSGARLAVERCESAGGEAANRWYTLGVRGASGKEVRQLFERQGLLVGRVLRTQLGPLTLERTLARGRARELSDAELRALGARGREAADETGRGG